MKNDQADRARDRELGMHRAITRRDFLNGIAVGAGGALASAWLPGLAFAAESAPCAQDLPGYNPPALTGMRGSHAGAFEVAHALRDGNFWETAGAPINTNETYDLIVVGAGMSGLAAAYFYRKTAGPSARILVLDNHDDFGGHAKRNEFQVGGQTLLGYGGAQSLDGPDNYSAAAKALLADAGVVPKRFYTAFDQQFFPSRHLGNGIFFDRETFGADHLATGAGAKPWADVLAGAPLSERVRR